MDEPHNLTGRTSLISPQFPLQGLVSDRLRDAFKSHAGESLPLHDSYFVRCDYSTIERRLAKSIGPRAPKRKRRKRLRKKLKQRGGMLRTRGFVQSYFNTWPAMCWWLP